MTEQTKEALLAIEKAKKEYNEKVGKKYPIQQELPRLRDCKHAFKRL